jgi:hypothetical protein
MLYINNKHIEALNSTLHLCLINSFYNINVIFDKPALDSGKIRLIDGKGDATRYRELFIIALSAIMQ